ncbi:disease resistance protein RUN1-like [Quercus robur]|uniref:disease resistance protein RUN1-like n=1 Tax=Quercus robur TaxID=38942 RepID=UPI002161FFA3|nr:disease resistance protein RUN1-like [Quercus robur]
MASSSFRTPPCTCNTYDVFISFRGEDTRTRFTDHLCKALKDKSIRVFRDDSDLERGKTIWEELVKVIKTSRIAVIVFSKNYANSRWCLDELVVIMDCKSSTTRCKCNQTLEVVPIFYEVSPSDVREQKGNFAEVPPNFSEDTVKKWRKALTDCTFVGLPLGKDR